MKFIRLKIIPLLITIGIFSVITIFSFNSLGTQEATGNLEGSVTSILSESLFTDYVAPFLIIGVLLVAALVAGVYLAQSETERRERLFQAVRKKPRFDADEARESMEESNE